MPVLTGYSGRARARASSTICCTSPTVAGYRIAGMRRGFALGEVGLRSRFDSLHVDSFCLRFDAVPRSRAADSQVPRSRTGKVAIRAGPGCDPRRSRQAAQRKALEQALHRLAHHGACHQRADALVDARAEADMGDLGACQIQPVGVHGSRAGRVGAVQHAEHRRAQRHQLAV